MDLKAIIKNKYEGKQYTYDQLKMFVLGYVKNEITDEEMTDFIRSIYEKGMTTRETAELTEIMMNSGDIINLKKLKGIKVDKHSTGGVGDKVTLIVAPIVASLGAPVAKMSGRGLGFTGGTLDKLESIPGYNINLSERKFKKNVKKHGIAVIGQTKELVPADKKMYALRDETNLIDSIPLIASSIMSKKLATGSDAILLDVKCGDAAFMKTQKDAETLAKAMIALGKHLGRDVRAEITSMDNPLGRAIGNKLEVLEAIKALQGGWTDDLKQVIYSSASTMLVQAGIFENEALAKEQIDYAIGSEKAFDKAREWIESQGGDFDAILREDFWTPKYKHEIIAKTNGFMNITSAVSFGILAMKLGAGREKKEDGIDYDAGIYLNKKTGEAVKKGDVLFTLYSNKKIKVDDVALIASSYKVQKTKKTHKVILNKL